MPTLHIQLLGTFQARFNAEPLGDLSPQTQLLLAYLLLHRHAPQSRQQIAFLFWPDSAEPQAYRNLRRELSLLRKWLPTADAFLHVNRQTLQWRMDAPYTLDVEEFETKLAEVNGARAEEVTDVASLQEAIDAYSGQLLPHLYDDWVLTEREQLADAYHHALQQLLDCYETEGNYSAAIKAAQRLLRHDPLQELVYRRLMQLHAYNQDRTSALRIYRECVAVLDAELGVEPAHATTRLYERLQRQEQSDTIPIRIQDDTIQGKMVGRRAEWRQLLAARNRITQRSPHFMLLIGEAGIGKTRLAEEILHYVERQGIATARTRSYAAEGNLAYAPVVEWLRSDDIQITLASLDAVWLTEIARILPELLTEHPHVPTPEPMTQAWQRRQLFEGLARALLVERQPKLLLLDDIQWTDEETLAWLRFLFHFDTHAPLSIIATARTEEMTMNQALGDLLTALHREGQATEIDLHPLDSAETTELAIDVLHDEIDRHVAARLYAETGGNPLFVVETIRAGIGHLTGSTTDDSAEPMLPPKVQAVIQGRLALLSPTAQEVAQLAAAIGRAFSLDLLAAAMPNSNNHETIVNALEELWQRRIIQTDEANRYDVSHDRIREVAYAEISPVRQPSLHLAIANALATLHAADLDPVAAQLALHYTQSGQTERSAYFYKRAGTFAARRFAFGKAIAHFKEAIAQLSLLPDSTRHQKLVLSILIHLYDCLQNFTGHTVLDLLDTLLHAHKLSSQVGTPDQTYFVLSKVSNIYSLLGEDRIGLKYVEQMVEMEANGYVVPINAELDDTRMRLGWHYIRLGRFREAHECLDMSGYPPEMQRKAAGRRIGLLWVLGYPEQAYKEMVALLVPVEERPGYSCTHRSFAADLMWCLRRPEEVKIHVDIMTDLASHYELGYWFLTASMWQGWLRVQRGEVGSGLEQIRTSVIECKEIGRVNYAQSHLLLADAYAMIGQIGNALEALAEGFEFIERTEQTWWLAELHRTKGELLLQQGDGLHENIHAAESYFQQALATARQQEAKSLELRAAMSLARLWQVQGKETAAHDLLFAVYNWFTEGFDTADLQEAKHLLHQLV